MSDIEIDTEDSANVIVDQLVKNYLLETYSETQVQEASVFLISFAYLNNGGWIAYAQDTINSYHTLYGIQRDAEANVVFEAYDLHHGETYLGRTSDDSSES